MLFCLIAIKSFITATLKAHQQVYCWILHLRSFKLELSIISLMKNAPSDDHRSESIQQNSLQKYQIHSRVRHKDGYQPLSAECDYGILNQYKLEDLINVQSDGFRDGAILRVAFIENHSLHLEEDAIQVFEQYAKHEIALVSIYAKEKAGKSLLLDKILNLTEVEGSHFAQMRHTNKGIYMWSIPFSRGNTKVFLMDIDGCDVESEDYQMLLTFLLFLTSSILLLASPSDLSFQELTSLCKQIKKSRKCFTSKDEADVQNGWPIHLYCLLRSPISSSKPLQSLRRMFARFSWRVMGNAMEDKHAQQFTSQDLKQVPLRKYAARKKMLSEAYIKGVSAVLRHAHAKIQCKQIQTLRFTGANLVKLAVNAVQSLNVKGELALDRIARRSLKQLYEQAYEYHTQLYNQHLAGYLADERPFEVDYLINSFKDCNQLVFKSFNTLTTSPQFAQAYGEKLQRYIAQKERMILAINKKKCASEAKQAVPTAKPVQVQQINQFIREAKQSPKCFQQVYAEQIVPVIATALKEVETQRKTIDDKESKTKSATISSKIQQKESELQKLKKNNEKKTSVIKESQMKKEYFQNKQKQLNEAVKRLKTQLLQKKSVEQKEAPGKSPQQLLLQQQKLQKQSKIKQKTINELRSQKELPRSIEQIQLLNSQIQQKVMKQRELESALASHIPKLQSIQTFRSNSKISTPRKVQSRAFKSQSPNIRIISSPKA